MSCQHLQCLELIVSCLVTRLNGVNGKDVKFIFQFFLNFPPPLLPNRTVHYCLTNNKHFSFPSNSLPEQLRNQKQIVELMANYMEENLMEVGKHLLVFSHYLVTDLHLMTTVSQDLCLHKPVKGHLKRL